MGESQEQHIAVEHMRRKALTREELLESLRKEAAMQAKILELERAEQDEKQRFEMLRAEEAQLHTSLHEMEKDDKQTDANVTSSGSALPTTGDDCAALGAEVMLSDGACAQDLQLPPERRCECVVCLNALRCTVFLPCKHLVCCEECGQGATMQRCPMCRAKIDWRFNVFL